MTPREGPPPAKLDIDATQGADIHVDGVIVGVAPLDRPVDADPGPHHVAVTMNGHEPWSRPVVLERGRTTKLEVDLDETIQRKLAWAAMGVGGAGVATGIVFGVLSVIEHRASRDLAEDFDDFNAELQQEFNETIARRDDYRMASGIAAGLGLGLFVTGAILFAFDAPVVPTAPGKDAPKNLSVMPVIGLDHAGLDGLLRW